MQNQTTIASIDTYYNYMNSKLSLCVALLCSFAINVQAQYGFKQRAKADLKRKYEEALRSCQPVMRILTKYLANKSNELPQQHHYINLTLAMLKIKSNKAIKRFLQWDMKDFLKILDKIVQAKGHYRLTFIDFQRLFLKYNSIVQGYKDLFRQMYPSTYYASSRSSVYSPCDCGNSTEQLNAHSMKGFETANIALVLDVSGSMTEELPMIKKALKYLSNIARPKDKVSLISFSDKARTILKSVSITNHELLVQAIDRLRADGDNGGEKQGLAMAYRLLKDNYKANGNNRVIFVSDGGFKITDPLLQLIAQNTGEGINLSVFSRADNMMSVEVLKQMATLGKGRYASISPGNIVYKFIHEAQSIPTGKKKHHRVKRKNVIPCNCNSNEPLIQQAPALLTPLHKVNLRSMQGFAHNNLMLLLDVSGSMANKNKLPLLKRSFKYLTNIMRPEDDVSIVIYAGDASVALKPTSATNQDQIIEVIDNLRSQGKTNIKAGFKLAYKWMSKNFKQGGNNRIILATDGEFPIDKYIYKLVGRQAERGINLSVFSFGNSKKKYDSLQKLVEKGKGNYEHVNPTNANYKLVKEAQSKQMK